MIEKLKQWLNIACDAFMRGVRAEAPPGGDQNISARVLIILRDVILFLVELILTGAGIFTYVLVTSSLVKIFLGLAVIISAMRTYTVGKQLRDTVFRTVKGEK